MCREVLMKAEVECVNPWRAKLRMGESRPAKGHASLQGKGFSCWVCSAHQPGQIPAEDLAQQGLTTSLQAAGTTSPVSDQERKACARPNPNLLEGWEAC